MLKKIFLIEILKVLTILILTLTKNWETWINHILYFKIPTLYLYNDY